MEWEWEALPPNHHSGQLFPDGSDCFNFLVEELGEPESSLFHVTSAMKQVQALIPVLLFRAMKPPSPRRQAHDS